MCDATDRISCSLIPDLASTTVSKKFPHVVEDLTMSQSDRKLVLGQLVETPSDKNVNAINSPPNADATVPSQPQVSKEVEAPQESNLRILDLQYNSQADVIGGEDDPVEDSLWAIDSAYRRQNPKTPEGAESTASNPKLRPRRCTGLDAK
jgi:hypothetical protein